MFFACITWLSVDRRRGKAAPRSGGWLVALAVIAGGTVGAAAGLGLGAWAPAAVGVADVAGSANGGGPVGGGPPAAAAAPMAAVLVPAGGIAPARQAVEP